MGRAASNHLHKSKKGGSIMKDLTRKPALKLQSPLLRHGNKFSPYKKPVRISRSKLFTIHEDSAEAESVTSDASVSGKNLLQEIYTSSSDTGDDLGSVGSDLDDWDDESTLVARLQTESSYSNERESLISLAEQLKGPMEARSDALKQYLAHTVAPVTKRVKEAHNLLEQKVDVAFGVGVLSFDDACKKVEKMALEDEDDWKLAYSESQRNMKSLISQLSEAYTQKEKLWDNLEKAVEESASRTLENLSSLPADMEQAISTIEKKAKALTKSNPGDSKTREKMLRDLLGNI